MPVREQALGEIVEEEPAAPSKMKQLYNFIGTLFAAETEQENLEADDESIKEEEEEKNVQNHEDIILC